MKRQVRWSRDALNDLKRQVNYIAADNPNAALRIAERIQTTAAALGNAPTGRPGRVDGTYEKSVPKLPYVIAFAITETAAGEAISILRIIHTSRNWPNNGWPVD